MPPPHLANGALCLSTPNHNGKSGTEFINYCFEEANQKTNNMLSHSLYFSIPMLANNPVGDDVKRHKQYNDRAYVHFSHTLSMLH